MNARHVKTPLTAAAALAVWSSFAGVPLRWTVETTRATPATFEAYHGETLEIEADMMHDGKPLDVTGAASLYWQTNGMGTAYWQAPAAASSNRFSATWSPTNDVGARVYNCFIGAPGSIFRAAFQLRLRPSPGARPNVLPLPTPVIDFATVTVLNPPWPTNAADKAYVDAATNAIRRVDGSARPLPKYLHALDYDDTYPDAAEEYYRSRGDGKADGGCSAVSDGGFLYRNFDFPFDERAEFVVKMSAGPNRFASVGVAQVGTNLTEAAVTSGKPSRWYKALPGATVDGINEHGVVCEINVVNGTHPRRLGGDIHPLAAVRWALDNGTSAGMAASNLASRIMWPVGWKQNFHWMIADERETWIVENGAASNVTAVAAKRTMTNFPILPDEYEGGEGFERYQSLTNGANIMSQWWTAAYLPTTSPIRFSDLGTNYESIWERWAEKPKEQHRGEVSAGQTWWQSVHTSIYDFTNRTLRVAVQEVDDWYTFAVPSAGGTDEAKVRYIAESVVAPVASSVTRLESSKADKTDTYTKQQADDNATAKANAAIAAAGCVRTNDGGFVEGDRLDIGSPTTGFTLQSTGLWSTDGRTYLTQGSLYLQNGGTAEIKRDGYDVVYGISVNGGDPQHGDVSITVPPVYTPSATDPTFSNAVLAAISDMETKTHAAATYQPKGSYLTSETDPTVKAWAKADSKPSYTAAEVGALPDDTTIPAALSQLTDDATHRVVTDAEKSAWNAKQSAISDLDDIRAGAEAGATAVQPAAIADMETKTHAAATYQPKGSYLTSESDPTVKAWAKADSKPSYTAAEVHALPDDTTIPSALSQLTADATHRVVTDAEKSAWNAKQSAISDLADIRAGAEAGATAVQPAAIADMETKTHAAATYQPKGSYLTSESDPTATAKANAAIAAAGCVRTNEHGSIELYGDTPGIRMGASEYNEGSIYNLNYGLLYFPWGSGYGRDPFHDFATRADIPDASNVVRTNDTGAVLLFSENPSIQFGAIGNLSASYDDDTEYLTWTGRINAFKLGIPTVGYFTWDGFYEDFTGVRWMFPFMYGYGTNSTHDIALVSQIEAATNGIPETIGSVEFTAYAALDSADAAQGTANDALFLANNASADAADAQAHSEATRAMIPSALSQLTADATHRVVTDAEKSAWNAKQSAISDLADIRSGAEAGATAVQPAAIADMETKTHAAATYQPKGSYLTSESDPTVKAWAKADSKPSYTAAEVHALPDDTTIPSALSQLTDDATHRVVTDAEKSAWNAKQSAISDLADIRAGAEAGATAVQPPTAPIETATLSYQPDGSAALVAVPSGGTLSASVSGWIEGQPQTALILLNAGASIASNVRLVGYGSWPVDADFLASCVRVGSNVYVTPIVAITE